MPRLRVKQALKDEIEQLQADLDELKAIADTVDRSPAVKEITAYFRNWLLAPSIRESIKHLAGRRAQVEATAAWLLTVATPEAFAAVMNRLYASIGEAVLYRDRRNLPRQAPFEAAVEAARNTQAAAWEGASEDQLDACVSELADLIDFMLEAQAPNITNVFDAFNAIARIEVECYKPASSAEASEDPFVRDYRRALQLLQQAK